MEFISSIREKSKNRQRTIVLPEGNESRMIRAADVICKEKLAKLILVGEEDQIIKQAEKLSIDTTDVLFKNPKTDPNILDYAAIYYELRKEKGVDKEFATKVITSPLFYGAMLVRQGIADGCVAGSVNTTGDVLKAALHIIGLEPGISVVSGAFIMVIPGWKKVFTFADSAVVPDPTADQLAAIARASAKTHHQLTNEEAVVALLSFSTKGSAEHPSINKINEALQLVQETDPSLKIDGELQLDAAILPEIGKSKAPDSLVAGNANVLIFPDLNSGNIGYKLVNRFAKADAIGPIVQGLRKPANDLSRGCSVEDIINVVAICSLMSNE